MAYWLVKTEPDTFSWNEQVERGARGEPWTGVRNHQAKNNLMKMKKGDLAFFYHSGEGREIVGIVEVTREHYPDPTDESKKFVTVGVVARTPVHKPVTLTAIRAEPRLAEMVVVKNSRLSVQPVNAQEWARVCRMGGVKD
jgi:predicted RNA-binding protein with PUA-like domain